MEAREHTQGNLQLLREKLDSGRMRSARLMVHSLHPAEIARLLESLPLQERAVLWEMVSPDDEGDVLVELSDEVRDGLIEGMQTDELIAATAGMDFDDLADLLADLGRSLEAKGHESETVARFLMRCLFTMFAEDIGLLPKRSFTSLLEELKEKPADFVPMLQALWQDMNRGSDFSLVLRENVLKFNGGLFANPEVLPLNTG